MPPLDLRPRILHFLFQPGCGACEEAEPVFDEYVRTHPMIMALRLNVNAPHALDFPVKIRATPTWIYRVGDRAAVREGMITVDDLTKWIEAAEEALR